MQSMAEDLVNNAEERDGAKTVSLGIGALVGIVAAALVVGVLVGRFAVGTGGVGLAGAVGKATLTEDELSSVVATYSYAGTSADVTAREVIEQFGSLSTSKDADGNYAIPSADNVLTLVRNKIIADEAAKRGIEVADEDITAFAEDSLGSSDFEQIANSYSMDVEAVKALLRQSVQMTKLRDEVVGANDAKAPEAPAAPEYNTTDEAGQELDEEAKSAAQDAANKESKKEYADYVIGLAADEWDAKKGTWKAKDGPYASALADYKVTKKGASYEAAQAAYYVAYQDYSNAQTEVSTKWTDFVNGLLVNASVSLNSLVA